MTIAGVASSGGHLIQLEALLKMGIPISVVMSPAKPLFNVEHDHIPDCNLKSPLRVLLCTWRLLAVIMKRRPHTIISTGAAPGGIAIVLARMMGSRTIWIDSIANAQRASLTGRLVKPFTNVWISQWDSVARQEKGVYLGKIFSFFDGGNATSV